MVRIIKDKHSWDRVLDDCRFHDSYHTFEYHKLSSKAEEDPLLFVYTDGDTIIALPLLIREIAGTAYKDATSVYGYAGPVCNKTNLAQSTIDQFSRCLCDYLFDAKIISVFNRLHPFFPQQLAILDQLGKIELSGQVVFIDLNQSTELQRAKYNRRLKTHINRTRRECRIYKVNEPSDVLEFKKLYYHNMDRVQAHKSYYFTTEYFQELNACVQFDVTYYLIEELKSKSLIGGGIMLRKNDVAQYHLSGTRDEFRHLSPTKLLVDQMRIDAFDSGAKYFNLGGGKGGSRDNLYRFKSLFSPDHKPFYLWKYIVNPGVYEELQYRNSKSKDLNFFPAYRG